ncbi:MAG: YceI family protein [Desulfurivibrionaceae bacterium]
MAKWRIDPDHSVAAFKIRHMKVAHVHGQFNRLRGAAEFDPDDPSSFALEVAIESAGLYTGIAQRDEHLRSSDFLDTALYPAISFKGSDFTAGAGGGRLAGDLDIHGITRPISLELVFAGPVRGPEEFGGEITLGVAGAALLNREEFGMNWNVPLDDGGWMVGRDVYIEIDLELDLEK